MRLFKRKSNGVWYAELKRNRPRSLQTRDEREAKVRFREIEREMLKGNLLLLDRENKMPFSDFLHEYVKWLNENRSYNTYERFVRIATKAIDGIGNKPINLLKRKDLDKYVIHCRSRKNSPVTINIELRHLKAAGSYAVEAGYLKENPFKGYKQLKYHKKQPNFIEDVDVIERIFSIINEIGKPKTRKIYRLIFALYVYTGARRSEIWKLEWKDIKNETIVFRERKNYEMLELPIVPKLKAILAEYEKGVGKILPITLDQIGRRIKYYLRKAGVGHLRPHDLRHTFASHLLMNGVDIETVRRLLGQTSLIITTTYSHILDRHKKEEIKKLPY